jgi:hypothetical protein
MTGIMSLQAAAMRRQRRGQGQSARVVNLPAPVGGWNARDSLAEMPPTDAVSLTNWWPTTSDVMVRMGYQTFATGLPTQVNSLMPYNPSSGSQKLFAASGSSIYDISAGGAVGAPVLTSLTSSVFGYTNFATQAGPYLLCVNGVDGYYVYNISTGWQKVTSSSTPISMTGVDPTTLFFVTSFASRVWFLQKNSLSAWYLPVESIGGAAQQFDLSPIFRRGGSLVSAGVWTTDGGYGMQDYLCFASSEGEIAIYGGTDPSQATTFALVGVYQLGSPMGLRSFMKYGSDLIYVGKDGMGQMSRLMSSTRVNTAVELTAKIQGAISEATSLYANNFGWCMVLFPLQNMLMLNVPVQLGQQQQYVMNTITGAWANFTGWNANCWERWEDQIYFGGNGFVGLAWNGFSDANSNINALGQQAFTEFGTPLQKRFTMMRPILWTNGAPALAAGINVDYDQNVPLSTLNFVASNFAVWDTAIWDSSIWGGALQVSKAWQGVSGIGMTGAATLKAATNGIETHWAASDIVFETGWIV